MINIADKYRVYADNKLVANLRLQTSTSANTCIRPLLEEEHYAVLRKIYLRDFWSAFPTAQPPIYRIFPLPSGPISLTLNGIGPASCFRSKLLSSLANN